MMWAGPQMKAEDPRPKHPSDDFDRLQRSGQTFVGFKVLTRSKFGFYEWQKLEQPVNAASCRSIALIQWT